MENIPHLKCEKLAYEVLPPGISIAVREMIPSRKPELEDIKVYQKLNEQELEFKYICYEPEDIDLLSDVLKKCKISKQVWCMFVIGHYTGKISNPEKIPLFTQKLIKMNLMLIGQYVHLLKRRNFLS